MRKCWGITILFCFLQLPFYSWGASDSLLIRHLLESIANDQVKENDKDFFEGMFPTFREWGASPVNRQPDNNVYFTAITNFTLKNLIPKMGTDQQSLIQLMIKKGTACYPNFLNKKPGGLYEFFPADNTFMPNSLFLKYFKKQLSSGEDADDCVMVFMTKDHPDSILNRFHQKLINAANLSRKRVVNTFKKYRDIPAYSTFLGPKMKIDFDFCVQTNVMYYLLGQKQKFEKQDEATLTLLLENVRNRDYIFHPAYISPWYANSSLLIYHIARLLDAYEIPAFNPYKAQLIDDAKYLLKQPSNIMEKVILSTSILRLGGELDQPLVVKDLETFEKSNHQSFPFFQARGSGLMSNTLKRLYSVQGPAFYFNFSCPSYNKTLLLEYLVEKQMTD
ncbi:hypothetical protein [Sediminibacterium sp.]|uniref:hypothetical protein n=1 Tax=Sediminibacterium sp. TaxID=1917865 RepID=UPI003F6F5F33